MYCDWYITRSERMDMTDVGYNKRKYYENNKWLWKINICLLMEFYVENNIHIFIV